jgi:cytidine deaminase
MLMNDRMLQELTQRALEARLQAYAPYSKFRVGAAILLPHGEIIVGCNVENASYGLSLCAERNAATAMVAQGFQQIAAVAVATQGGVSPCGACRQFLAEFGGDFPVFLVDAESERLVGRYQMGELLPHAFDSSRLPSSECPNDASSDLP